MFLNPRMNLFNFQFTRDFMPLEIKKKYSDYLNKVVANSIPNPLDYINYSIQGVNLPGMTFDPTAQTSAYGQSRKYLGTIHPQENTSKEMTVTFKMFDGFLNYWILFDLFNYYYSYNHKEKFIPNQKVEILDSSGNVVTNVMLERVLFTNIGDLNLNYSSNVPEFTTFDITLTYNQISIKQLFDGTI